MGRCEFCSYEHLVKFIELEVLEVLLDSETLD
jgi:hypothetical protein